MSNTKRFKKHTNINLRNIKQHQTIISVLKSELLKIISSKIIEFNFNFNSAKTNIEVERSKSSNHGDYCSNIAIMLFSNLEQRIMFAKMVSNLLPFSIVEFSEISSNGFINMFINKKFLFKILNIVLTEKDKYGEFGIKRKEFYNIEFVSANPTGLLHIGHARNAAIGDVLSNIWKMYGITVNKEYYINDGGNQINNLGVSLLVRYKQCLGVQAEMPLDAYHGQEIIPIAKELISEIGDRYIDVSQDDHRNIKTKSIINFFANYAKDCLLDLIKLDLADLGINFDI
jgi:arginyl-tRNA synthetase